MAGPDQFTATAPLKFNMGETPDQQSEPQRRGEAASQSDVDFGRATMRSGELQMRLDFGIGRNQRAGKDEEEKQGEYSFE